MIYNKYIYKYTAWCADYWWGSARVGGGGGGGQKKSIKPSKPPGIYENGRFPTLIYLNNAKNAVFYLKVLNKIYSQDVF
jgi:hypothetical protein